MNNWRNNIILYVCFLKEWHKSRYFCGSSSCISVVDQEVLWGAAEFRKRKNKNLVELLRICGEGSFNDCRYRVYLCITDTILKSLIRPLTRWWWMHVIRRFDGFGPMIELQATAGELSFHSSKYNNFCIVISGKRICEVADSIRG